MKRLLITLSILVLATAALGAATYTPASVPNVHVADRSAFVANPDGILSARAVAVANAALDTLRRKYTVEPMVVALDNIEDPDDPAEFATKLFTEWGMGKSDLDNGLLILIVKDQRKATIRTGYGLEGVLPDITCGRIIRNIMAPEFRDGDYDAGVLKALAAIGNIIADPATAAEYRSNEADKDFAGDDPDFFTVYLIIVGIMAIAMLAILIIQVVMLRGRSDYDKYRSLAPWRPVYLALSAFGIGIPLIASIPLILCLNHWRNHTRHCPNCGARMHKVDEVHDNDYLTPSQDLEERIGSVDYDVWLCPQCGETDILPYTSTTTPYVECDNCHARTARLVRNRILVQPTTSRKGRGVREYECLNCGHHNDRYYDIDPAPDVAKGVIIGSAIGAAAGRGGGGSFGGGSFGGGFGGGMTGGGGATGGW